MEDEDLPLDGDVGAVDAPAEDDGLAPNVNDAAPPTVEDIAARMGWSPQDQWRGDPAKWKPAHEFVAATADINRKVVDRLKTLEEQTASMARTSAAIMEQQLAKQREELLAERREAFEVGDGAKFEEVEQKLQRLQQAPVQAPLPPEVSQFVERNSNWFQKDQEATTWAISRADELAKQGLSPARQVAIVERELGQYFPEYAPQPAQPKPKAAPLTPPGNRAGNSRAKTFADLPKEAQAAAIAFEKKGVSREQYVKIFFEEQEA